MFLKKFKSRLGRQSRPSKIDSAGTEELHNQPAVASPSPAPSASAGPVEGPRTRSADERPNETPAPPNLWQTAFSQLEDNKKRLLTIGLANEKNVHCNKDMTSLNIEDALNGVIDTVQDQCEIRRLKNDNRLHKVAKQILESVLTLQKSIGASVACDPTGHASTAWSIVSLGLMMTQTYCDQQEQWFESSAFLADAVARTTIFEIHYLNKHPNTKEAIEKALLHVYTAVLNYSAEVIKIGRSCVGRKILKTVIALNKVPLTDIKNAIQNEELRLDSLARMQEYLCLDVKANRMLALEEQALKKVRDMDEDLVLSKLPVSERAAFNSHTNEPQEYCLENTRVQLLEEIDDWVNDSQAKSIFWLQGMAGTGKSTISRTVARDLKQRGLLGASFFFNRSERDRARSEKLLTTIIKQLIDIQPQFQDGVTKAIRQDSTLVKSSLGEQFDRLLKEPFSTVKTSRGQKVLLVIVIDALDECQDDINIQNIIKRLPELQHTVSAVELRFFMTSRPESRILSGFKEVHSEHTAAILHEISQSTVEHDIRVYFQDKLPNIRRARGLDERWPGEENIQRLVQMTVPLFIYAATMYRVFEDPIWDPQVSLEGFLNHPEWQSSQLSGTYLPVLERLLSGQREGQVRQLVDEFQTIVGAVIILQNPLPIMPLAKMLGIHEATIKNRLNTLQSVIRVPREAEEPVTLFHQSFRDYLLNPEPLEKTKFSIERAAMNRTIGLRCIRVMQRKNIGLKRNICGLSSFGTLRTEIDPLAVQANLPIELQYACRYWASHLQQGNLEPEDQNHIHQFLQKHFLHWLEATGVMGIVTEAIGIVKSLLSIENMDSELSRFLYDAKRFILENSQMIDIAPLQLYYAGLTFSPMKSCIRQVFEVERSERIRILPQVKHWWSAKLQTLEGHSGWAQSVAFSPDGQTVASGSNDKTIKLWDAATGKEKQTLTGHSSWVLSVAFSPDGQALVSGSYDNTVKLWDTTTGKEQQTLKGHSECVTSVAFSPDGQTIASGSYDKTVKLWDAITYEENQTLNGHSEWVRSVAFSINGRTVASSSNDRTVKLWVAATSNGHNTLHHFRRATSVAFSPDGQTLASGSDDKIIRLWDITAGKEQQPLSLRGHSSWIRSLAFSPDGQTIVSCSNDKTIKLWKATTGEEQRTLKDDSTSSFWSVAFSPDGRTMASGSDKTIKLWDAATPADEEQQTFRGHSGWVRAVSFSPDGQTVASGSDDKTIKLWDATTGEEKQTISLKGPGWVRSVAFSPDGQTLAAGLDDKTIKFWDATTAEEQEALKGHTSSVQLTDWASSGTSSYAAPDQPNLQLPRTQDWVEFGGERLLWLPSEYRTFSCSDTKGGLLALGYGNGRVIIVGFYTPAK